MTLAAQKEKLSLNNLSTISDPTQIQLFDELINYVQDKYDGKVSVNVFVAE